MTDFPAKRAEGDCAGWLTHNLQLCPCYADERQAQAKRERMAEARRGVMFAFAGVLAAIAGVLGACLNL